MLKRLFSRQPIKPCDLSIALSLPVEEPGILGFCGSNKPARVNAWFDSLPVTDYNTTCSQLYHALPELTKVHLTTSHRAEILDHIRPLILRSVSSVTSPLVKRPLNLSESEKKIATIAQASLKYLAAAYCRNAINALADKKTGEVIAAKATHRALHAYALLLKSNYRLYTPVPNDIWRVINTLFNFCRAHNLDAINVRDPEDNQQSGTTEQLYLRILALAVARPLQLRPSEVENLYNQLPQWSKLLTLSSYDADQSSLFAVLTCSDREPDYTDTFSQEELNHGGLSFDFQPLLANLDKDTDDRAPVNLTAVLEKHLRLHWGTRVQRRNMRTACSDEYEVCVGLTSIHNQLIKGANFDEFVIGSSSEDGFAPTNAWIGTPKEPEANAVAQAVVTMSANNSGPQGFQLQCQNKVPLHLQTGELIGFREPGKRQWQVAVIRWLKRSDKMGVQLGAKVLAHRTEAYGAATITATGRDSDYLRVLIVRESAELTGESIITPSLVFTDRHPITLKKRGDSQRIQISQSLLTTASFSQFRYKTL